MTIIRKEHKVCACIWGEKEQELINDKNNPSEEKQPSTCRFQKKSISKQYYKNNNIIGNNIHWIVISIDKIVRKAKEIKSDTPNF